MYNIRVGGGVDDQARSKVAQGPGKYYVYYFTFWLEHNKGWSGHGQWTVETGYHLVYLVFGVIKYHLDCCLSFRPIFQRVTFTDQHDIHHFLPLVIVILKLNILHECECFHWQCSGSHYGVL